MKKVNLLLLFFTANFLHAQQVTWAEHIAPIVFKKCGTCHHDGGIAPFDLTSWDKAISYASAMKAAVSTGHMPPWPPDPAYRHFAFERTLSAAEKQAIVDWVDLGVPSGNLSQTPPVPDYPAGGQLPGTPDLVLQIPTYTITSTEDDYRCFVIPNQLLQDKFITAWEIVPGNRSIVHHVLAYQDATGQCAANDAATPEPGYKCFGSACDGAEPFGAWAPGGNPLVYPPGMGIRLKTGVDLVIEMHYPADSQGQTDSTKIHFFFAPNNNGMREVFFDAVADPFSTIQNGPFFIPANQVKTFNTKLNLNFGADLTLLRVLPHMHLLGKSMQAWVVDPQGNTTNLVKIPQWDFHWQGMYAFPQPIRLKNNGKLYSTFTYDNTTANPENPNSPPQTVVYGENTTDEMLFLFAEYLVYQPGDENIVLDSSFLTSIFETPEGLSTAVLYPCQPNPMTDFTTIPFYLAENQKVSLSIVDLAGREIARPLELALLAEGMHSIPFKKKMSPGMYFVVLRDKAGRQKMSKFVVQ